MSLKMQFSPTRSVSARLAGLLGILLLSELAYAAGENPPAGLQGLFEVLLEIIIYPYIGVALAFLVYNAFKKLWAFALMPVFYWGVSSLAPIAPPLGPLLEDSLVLYSSVVAWLYIPPILATVIGYWIYSRTRRVWFFVLVPVFGWILQLIGLVFISLFMNRTIHL